MPVPKMGAYAEDTPMETVGKLPFGCDNNRGRRSRKPRLQGEA